MPLSEELQSALETPGERAAAAFLAKNPQLVYWAFARTDGHASYVLKEFPFGSRYKADFVVLYAYSRVWEIHLIELEPPKDPIITKKGVPSARLSKAISQVSDWREYFLSNRAVVQRDLNDWCGRKDLLGWMRDPENPCNFTGDELRDPSIYIDLQCHVIIGRRGDVSSEKGRKMNQYRFNGFARVGTFDRFLDIARNIDRREANPADSGWVSERYGE